MSKTGFRPHAGVLRLWSGSRRCWRQRVRPAAPRNPASYTRSCVQTRLLCKRQGARAPPSDRRRMPSMGHEARVFRSDRSQRRLPIAEAPHETGVAGFVDVSNDTDSRDSVQNLEPVPVRPVPPPLNFSKPEPACKALCFSPMEQFNMAKCAALPPFDCRRFSLKKTDAHTHDRGGGRHAPARCERQTGVENQSISFEMSQIRPVRNGWQNGSTRNSRQDSESVKVFTTMHF